MALATENRRFRCLKLFLGTIGVSLFFWWPLSHWLYPDLYHRLLGFAPGSWSPGLVRVIGTCGMVPVLLALAAARHPRRNKDAVIVLIVFCVLMALTYLHLIAGGFFPRREYVNVALCLGAGLALGLLYPWRFRCRDA